MVGMGVGVLGRARVHWRRRRRGIGEGSVGQLGFVYAHSRRKSSYNPPSSLVRAYSVPGHSYLPKYQGRPDLISPFSHIIYV